MILTSPSTDVDQDRTRFERLFAFVRARAAERLVEAERCGHSTSFAAARRDAHVIDMMFAQARRRRGVVAACAITFFRARAMRDAHHPDFLGEWLGGATPESRSA